MGVTYSHFYELLIPPPDLQCGKWGHYVVSISGALITILKKFFPNITRVAAAAYNPLEVETREH